MQFFMRNLNMWLVLKSKWKKWDFHRSSDKNANFIFFFLKKCTFRIWPLSSRKQNLFWKKLLSKWSAKNSLQILKVSMNLGVVAGSTGDFRWRYPHVIFKILLYLSFANKLSIAQTEICICKYYFTQCTFHKR